MYTGLWWGNLRERNHLVDPGTDGKIIKAESPGSGIWGGAWTGFDLPRIGGRWQALVNAVINLWVP